MQAPLARQPSPLPHTGFTSHHIVVYAILFSPATSITTAHRSHFTTSHCRLCRPLLSGHLHNDRTDIGLTSRCHTVVYAGLFSPATIIFTHNGLTYATLSSMQSSLAQPLALRPHIGLTSRRHIVVLAGLFSPATFIMTALTSVSLRVVTQSSTIHVDRTSVLLHDVTQSSMRRL
ncbi:hypothetical protein BaRGS_00003871 [Batillaria attramentaria]|uniref:Uncharacterized protein n=1 Tax=Batillaria attramentaria TaxID=370345 RepID=A0ABD0M0M9_9CAEN